MTTYRLLSLFVAAFAVTLLAVATARADTIYVSTISAAGIARIGPGGAVYPVLPTDTGGPFTVDANANLYVIDFSDTNILQVAPDGTATLYGANCSGYDLVFDGRGNLYSAGINSNVVYKVTPAGTVSTFAGGIVNPVALAIDTNGNVYVSDADDTTVRVFSPAGGLIRTFDCGTVGAGGLAVDASGNVYVDGGTSTINEITPNGAISTYASGLNEPMGMKFDSNGDLFVAEFGGGITGDGAIDEIVPGGAPTPFATGLTKPQYLAIQTPEPSSLALLSLGAFALLARRRRR